MNAQPLIVSKEERLIFLDRSAYCEPKLVLMKGGLLNIKKLTGIKPRVSEELKGGPVESIGS